MSYSEENGQVVLRMSRETRTVVWSSGGGTQSTAIAILILKGLLPRPDRAAIVDTGRETQATWEYLDNIVNPALRNIGLQVERIQCSILERNTFPPALTNPEGTLLIPAYEIGMPKLPNYCSTHWKRDALKRWALDNGLCPAVNWLGFSTDEMKRVTTSKAANWLLEYPLIFKEPRSREGCVNEIEQFGWPPAPKSSCWMCPNRRNWQWRELRDHRPDEFSKACIVDEQIRLTHPNVFLHESKVPLAIADLGEDTDDIKQLGLGCGTGDCFV